MKELTNETMMYYDPCNYASRSEEITALKKYLHAASIGETQYADGILGINWAIDYTEVKIVVNFLISSEKIYALAIGCYPIPVQLARGIIKCKHLKKIVFRIKPESEVLDILRQKEGLELIFRGEIPCEVELLQRA